MTTTTTHRPMHLHGQRLAAVAPLADEIEVVEVVELMATEQAAVVDAVEGILVVGDVSALIVSSSSVSRMIADLDRNAHGAQHTWCAFMHRPTTTVTRRYSRAA